jgi:hypothetical protein
MLRPLIKLLRGIFLPRRLAFAVRGLPTSLGSDFAGLMVIDAGTVDCHDKAHAQHGDRQSLIIINPQVHAKVKIAARLS